MLDYEAIGNDRDPGSTLTEIMRRVDAAGDASTTGWNRQTARLFAMDAIRRDVTVLSEADRHNLTSYLQEAKGLVVAGRDDELGSFKQPWKPGSPSSPPANDANCG